MISRSSSSAMFTYGSFLHSPCTFKNEVISPGASLSPYSCDTVVIRFPHIIQTVLLQNFKKPFPQWRLQDFFVGGAKGGLNSSEGAKKTN